MNPTIEATLSAVLAAGACGLSECGFSDEEICMNVMLSLQSFRAGKGA